MDPPPLTICGNVIPFYSWVKGGVAGEREGWGEVVFSNPRIPHIESCKFGALWSESSSYHMQSENNNLLCMHCTKLMVMLFLRPPHKVQICRCTTYLKVSFKIIFVSLRRARTLANNKQRICEKKGREAAEVCLPLTVEVTLENWTGGDNTFLPPFAVWEDAAPPPPYWRWGGSQDSYFSKRTAQLKTSCDTMLFVFRPCFFSPSGAEKHVFLISILIDGNKPRYPHWKKLQREVRVPRKQTPRAGMFWAAHHSKEQRFASGAKKLSEGFVALRLQLD